MSWLGDVLRFDAFNAKGIVNNIVSNPVQSLLGADDPLSTGAWNAATGSHFKPYVDQWGGPTNETWQAARQAGINTGPASQTHGLAHLIAATEAGGYFGSGSGTALSKGSNMLGLTGTDVPSLQSPGDYGLTSSFPTTDTSGLSGSLPGMVGGNSGGLDFGNLLGSWLNYNNNQNLIKAGQGADPFAQYRPMYGGMLAALMQNPSSVTTLPGYQASLQAGEQSLTRNLASQGLTGSGTAAQAITNYGGQFENQFFQQMLGTLGKFAGSDINNQSLMLAALASGMSGKNQAVSSGLGGLFGGLGGSSGLLGGLGSMMGGMDGISALFDSGSILGGLGDLFAGGAMFAL